MGLWRVTSDNMQLFSLSLFGLLPHIVHSCFSLYKIKLIAKGVELVQKGVILVCQEQPDI